MVPVVVPYVHMTAGPSPVLVELDLLLILVPVGLLMRKDTRHKSLKQPAGHVPCDECQNLPCDQNTTPYTVPRLLESSPNFLARIKVNMPAKIAFMAAALWEIRECLCV